MTVRDLLELYTMVKLAEDEDIDIEDIDLEDIEDIEDEDEIAEEAVEMLDYADALEKTAELYRIAAYEDFVKLAKKKKRPRGISVKGFFKKYWPALLVGGAGVGAGMLAGYLAKKRRKKAAAAGGAAKDTFKILRKQLLEQLGDELSQGTSKYLKGVSSKVLKNLIPSKADLTKRLQDELVKEIVKARAKQFFKKNWPILALGGAGIATGALVGTALANRD